MRILITGGAGMVGSHTAEYYAKRGEDVTVLDNLMRSKLFGYDKKSVEFNWNYLKRYKNIRLVRGDVREKRDLVGAILIRLDAEQARGTKNDPAQLLRAVKAELGHDAEIVRYKKYRHAMLLLYLGEKIQYAGLYRNIKRRCRLIQNKQLR